MDGGVWGGVIDLGGVNKAQVGGGLVDAALFPFPSFFLSRSRYLLSLSDFLRLSTEYFDCMHS